MSSPPKIPPGRKPKRGVISRILGITANDQAPEPAPATNHKSSAPPTRGTVVSRRDALKTAAGVIAAASNHTNTASTAGTGQIPAIPDTENPVLEKIFLAWHDASLPLEDEVFFNAAKGALGLPCEDFEENNKDISTITEERLENAMRTIDCLFSPVNPLNERHDWRTSSLYHYIRELSEAKKHLEKAQGLLYSRIGEFKTEQRREFDAIDESLGKLISKALIANGTLPEGYKLSQNDLEYWLNSTLESLTYFSDMVPTWARNSSDEHMAGIVKQKAFTKILNGAMQAMFYNDTHDNGVVTYGYAPETALNILNQPSHFAKGLTNKEALARWMVFMTQKASRYGLKDLKPRMHEVFEHSGIPSRAVDEIGNLYSEIAKISQRIKPSKQDSEITFEDFLQKMDDYVVRKAERKTARDVEKWQKWVHQGGTDRGNDIY